MEPEARNTRQRTRSHTSSDVAPSCPICGGDDISTMREICEFDFGSDESAVALRARVPVHRCDACQFDFLDRAAERLKHRTVCDHLGVLRPDEIRRLREDLGVTREAFARLSGLGEDSPKLWEHGPAIQPHAVDRQLRILA